MGSFGGTYTISFARRYTKMAFSALDRGIPNELTLGQYITLVDGHDCHYCGGSLPNQGYGLDRKDSRGSLSLSNCVPCCDDCNKTKGSRIGYEEMLDLTKKRREVVESETSSDLQSAMGVLRIEGLHIDKQHRCLRLGPLFIYILNFKSKVPQALSSAVAFFQHEIHQKPDIVRSMIMHKLQDSIIVYARKLVLGVVPTNELREFFNRVHLKGYAPAPGFGLYLDDRLYMACSYKRKGGEVEIHRLATELGYSVTGGFSRLLQHIIKETSPHQVVSYMDRRYHSGHGLRAVGFEQVSISSGWFWTDGENIYNRLRCKANMDSRGLSEREHATELGWWKVSDAGQAKFVLKLQEDTKHSLATKKSESLEELTQRLNTCGLELTVPWQEYMALNRHRPLMVKCKAKGHVFTRTRTRLMDATTCPECDGKRRSASYSEVLRDGGWRLVDGVYLNKISNLTAECQKGHKFERQYRWFRDNKCPTCYGVTASDALGGSGEQRRAAVFGQILNHCRDTGQTLLTNWDEFKLSPRTSSTTKIVVQCQNGHQRDTMWQVVKQHGCGACNRPVQKKKEKRRASAHLPVVRGVAPDDLFGWLRVLEVVSGKQVICQCQCGLKTVTTGYKLLTGHTKSCGCRQFNDKQPVKYNGQGVLSDVEVASQLAANGYRWSGGVVENESSRVDVECLHCGIVKSISWRASFGRCLTCVLKEHTKQAFDQVQQTIEELGFEILDDFAAYWAKCQATDKRNSLIPIAYQCVNGHKQSIMQAKVKIKKRWACPDCLLQHL